ncbi:3-hydroxyacyl-CoA dehydrogenase [Enemella evansiae]|uniref:3-hydroxyacyl-CoA dehydrogenase n=1 Tax=Enemella evansiae TaxID=2016499 RepID=UPI000B96F90E|nr:3-hydroxyacyl-CoA dehydrogenase [Enemella evansiae]OYO13065.1 3-hydroxyacyl-CoA dehydrogenase [Enemella evansiae]TDO94244.1 NAD(P)-dependent dehydrogenase (short-subunit alcohol dehydrogenase family) [Enemella evansiae]
MQVSGRTALVTGGASGLGLATTKRLTEAGARVVVLDLDSDTARGNLAELGDAVTFSPGDVTSEADVQRAVDTAVELGDFAIVQNCAGIGTPGRVYSAKKQEPHALDLFQRVININLVGTFNVIRLAAKAIIEHTETDAEDRAVIINTASVAAYDGQIGQAAYSASKGGIVGMTLPIARDLAQFRIRVVTIAPGLFWTPLFAGLDEKAIESLGQQTPHPARLGDPSEYALLATQIMENPMLNGEVIRLDGAVRMAPR